MPSLSLLLLLATLPCAERESTARELQETAASHPEKLQEMVERATERFGGMPLPAGKDVSPTERAQQAAEVLSKACALQAAAEAEATPPPTSEPERLRAILDRPEFAHARQLNDDLLKRLLQEVEAWLDEFFQSRGAQGFAVATRAIMLGLALAVVLFGVLRFRARQRSRVQDQNPQRRIDLPLVLDAPDRHLGRARAALPTDAREAIREGLLGLLSALEQRRLARPDRVKTNRELAAELPDRGAPPPVSSEVTRLVGWYDQTFYSMAPVPTDEATRFVDEVERLHGALATEGVK